MSDFTIVVLHVAGTGFNSKSVMVLHLRNANDVPEVQNMLQGQRGLSQAAFLACKERLGQFGTLEDLGFKGYYKGLSAEHPEWPLISVLQR